MAQGALEEETGVRIHRQLPSHSKIYQAIFTRYTAKRDLPLLPQEKSKRKNCFLTSLFSTSTQISTGENGALH